MIKNSLPAKRQRLASVAQFSKSKHTIGLLLDLSNIILVKGEVHRDGSGLDGDTTINLVLTVLFVSTIPFFLPTRLLLTECR